MSSGRFNNAVRIAASMIAMAWLGRGCASSRPLSPPPRPDEPIGVQLMHAEPTFVGTPFRVLIDFESPGDLAFISENGGVRRDSSVAHTGKWSLQITPGAGPIKIKLGSLISNGIFPGNWTLAGGYFISRDSALITAMYEAEGKVLLRREIKLEPRKWTPVMLDVSTLNDPNLGGYHEVGLLCFKVDHAVAWCDDVMLIDNAGALAGELQKAGDHWTVRRRGFATLIERPGSFSLSIPTSEAAADGWEVTEANEMRIILTNPAKRYWVIYSDGSAYLDSQFKPLVNLNAQLVSIYQEQQRTPATLTIPPEQGRVERNAPGDRNNDGYAEATGAYQIKAASTHLRITITPRTPKLACPVLEIVGFPSGRLIANMEGQLVEQSTRLPNGHVLIKIPAVLAKPTELDVRVQ